MWSAFKANNLLYLVSQECNSSEITLKITDLKNLWCGVFGNEFLESEFKKQNSDRDITASAIVNEIQNAAGSIESQRMKIESNESNLKLTLQFTGALSNSALTLQLDKSSEFYDSVTLPLVLSIHELTRRQGELIKLLKRKDEEITEYKLEGAKISRKHIATKEFNESDFNLDCAVSSSDFIKRGVSDLSNVVTNDFVSLFSTVNRAITVKDEIPVKQEPVAQVSSRRDLKKRDVPMYTKGVKQVVRVKRAKAVL